MDRSPAALEQRSLAMHRAIAAKVRADPSLLDVAKRNIARWRASASPHSLFYLDAWQAVLDEGLGSTLATMLDASDQGVDMRKSSPFAGILTEAERLQILQAWRNQCASDW